MTASPSCTKAGGGGAIVSLLSATATESVAAANAVDVWPDVASDITVSLSVDGRVVVVAAAVTPAVGAVVVGVVRSTCGALPGLMNLAIPARSSAVSWYGGLRCGILCGIHGVPYGGIKNRLLSIACSAGVR
jgi:hypothetical protein